MLHNLTQLFAPAVQDRMCNLLNHVISREAHAMARLAPFAGRSVLVHLGGWPSMLPAAPDLVLQITPAGLWERLDAAPEDALRIELDASNPAVMALGALSGDRPKVTVQGDATLAGEINWLLENLRWDVEDDLARIVGPAPARLMAQWGQGIAQGFAALARGAARWTPSGRSGA
jgi:ubiquinone biosynthesis protein UbiJ